MTYTTVYDVANDSVGLFHPLFGLAVFLLCAVMKWGFGRPGWDWYMFMLGGLVFFVASGPIPWWDHRRVKQAVANGEAKQIEGPIHDWRLTRVPGKRYSTGLHSYDHFERFSVANVAFVIDWDSKEAGFANRGSTEEKPALRLSDGMAARIWYLPIDGPDKPPRIVRIDLGAMGWDAAVHQPYAGTAFEASEGRVTDDAHILSDVQKQQIDLRLVHFEQSTGHQMVVVTVPTLGGTDIARYAADLANRREIGRRGQHDGILLLIAPNERQARIAVGRGLADRLPDTAVWKIMDEVILPRFRRGDIPGGIEAGAAMLIDTVTSEERR